MRAGRSWGADHATAISFLFIALFALLTGLMLAPLDSDPTGFSGMFFLLRRLGGAGPEPFSTYWAAAWSYSSGGDTTCLPCAHSYHVKFSWGFVYPIMATAYAVIAETLRRWLPSHVNYLEIFVRAGSGALVCQWGAAVAAVAWALFRFRDSTLRAKVAVAAILTALFDYLVQNNVAIFNGHRFARYLHDGLIYAMTLPAPRGTVSALLGFYLAARLLKADGGRPWVIPLSLAFHLPVASMVCAVFLGAEALACAARRKLTGDLVMLGACTVFGLVATSAVGFTGYPTAQAGVLPAGAVLMTVARHALAHPEPVWYLPAAAAAACLAAGLLAARRPQWEAAGQALLVLSGLAVMGVVQFATGQAVMARLLTWHDNPSVHSLLYGFVYVSSAGLLGISLWLIVRGGELVSSWVAAGGGECRATAAVALLALLACFAGVCITSRTSASIRLRPKGPAGDVFVHVWKPERWFKTVYAPYAAAFAPHALSPAVLTFADRTFWLGKDWFFNASVSLRSFHQWVALGPIAGAPKFVPYPAGSRQHEVQEQPPKKQRRFAEGGQF